jgi:hypothetical protein
VAGRQQSSVAGDYLAVLRDQQRYGPAVAGDRGRDLRYLVGYAVVRIGPYWRIVLQ